MHCTCPFPPTWPVFFIFIFYENGLKRLRKRKKETRKRKRPTRADGHKQKEKAKE